MFEEGLVICSTHFTLMPENCTCIILILHYYYFPQLINYLRKDWLDLITTNVRMCLQDIGKGWFNIREKNWAIFELSKLSRYMELVKFRMQTALKLVVENSTDVLLKIVETPCQACLSVSDDFVWGNDLMETLFKPWAPPVFGIHLKMNNTSPFYSTNPDAFEVPFPETVFKQEEEIFACLLFVKRPIESLLYSISVVRVSNSCYFFFLLS